MRVRQIERRDEDVEKAMYRLKRLRKQNKDYFDENNSIREKKNLKKREMMIVYNTRRAQNKSRARKLDFR